MNLNEKTNKEFLQKTKEKVKLTDNEIGLLLRVAGGDTIDRCVRKSDREYDLTYGGMSKDLGCGYSAWLVLAFIRRLNWTSDPVASMTDYPDMVRAGDWSGVRDTEESKLWKIFHKVLPYQGFIESLGK